MRFVVALLVVRSFGNALSHEQANLGQNCVFHNETGVSNGNDVASIWCFPGGNREAFLRALAKKVSRDTMNDQNSGSEVQVRILGLHGGAPLRQGIPLRVSLRPRQDCSFLLFRPIYFRVPARTILSWRYVPFFAGYLAPLWVFNPLWAFNPLWVRPPQFDPFWVYILGRRRGR